MAEKIALLLSGLPRLWRKCLPTQLAMFTNHRVDVFCYFWDTIDAAEKADLLGLLKPKDWRFAAPADFSAEDVNPLYTRDRINIPSRMCSQYASWRGVADLFAPHAQNYRLAVRSRSDLQFIARLDDAAAVLGVHDLLLPWWDVGQLYSDLFAVGGAQVILHYHRLLDGLPEYAKTNIFNPEVLLMHHLAQYPGLRVGNGGRDRFFVRRPHMDNYTIEQAMRENPGFNKWLDPETVAYHKEGFARRYGEAGLAFVDQFRDEQMQYADQMVWMPTKKG